MKKVFLNVWKKALVLSLAAITFVITACGEDSGLGSTVDTEAPKIEITYPPLGANIRGTFVLAGSCDDDKSVKSIIVTVTDTTTKKVVGTVPASIENGGKSWKASVNNYSEEDKKYDYLDGNYQFTAEIHDGAGHKNSASRTFDLDNTAPVFVASNPGVIKSQNKKASAYGSIFTIDGTIADDHTIASLTAKIFDENGNLIGDYKEEDIATAGGTSVTIASHYVDKGDGTAKTVQNDRYTQIYGDNDEAGTKQYCCTVLVEDNTKSYTNPGESENTTSGNITSKIYLYDSVYKSLMSTKSGNRYGLSAADFMTLLNGTRAKDEKTETALKILKEVVVDTGLEAESDKDANKLSFSLNPMANPTYSVNGFAVSKDSAGNATYKEAFSDSTVVVSVNAGLDKTAILPGNLKVWTVLVDGLSPEDAQKRVNLVANKVTALQKIHSTVDEVHERADEIIDGAIKYADKEFGVGSLALVKDNSDNTGASVQTETLSCVLPKDTYISGKVYAFVVTGYDEDDVAFLHNTLYAFKANEAGIAPTLIITEPTNQSYIKTTEGLVFKGKTYLPDGSTLKVSSLKINLHVQDENKQNIAVGKQDGYTVTLTYDEATGYSSTDDSLTYNPTSKEWTFTPSKLADYKDISANEGEGKSYFYTLDITSESSSGNAASKTLSVHIDATMPTVSIANVTPCVSGKTFYSESGENIRNYVNGDISVKFNIEETNLKEVSYKVLVDGEEKVPSVSLGRQFSGSIDLDTTKWSASATEKKDFEVIITAVDTCGNTTSYSTTEYNTVTYNKSETETATFNKPIIICQETDIPQIKFNNTAELSYTTEKDGETVEHSFLVIEEPKGATEEQKAEVAKKNAENKKSIVATHNLFNIENNNTIQIALEDDDNIASAKVWVYDENGKLYKADGFENPSTLQVNKTSHTWNYVLPSKEGIYQIYVEVTDTKLKDDLSETVKLWRKNSVGKFFVAVDAGAPTVEIKTPVANSYQKVAFAASGTVSEKANITLERAVYKTGTEPKFVDVTGKIGAEKDGKYPWAETDADIKDLSDGDYILSYRATDRYEQSSTVSVNVKVDTKAPEFLDDESRVFVVSSALPGKAYVENTWYNNEAINIEGKFLEANGISNIYYWLDKDVGSLETATGSFTAVTEEEKDPEDETKVIRVVSNYKTTIPGFTESKDGHNLTLVAVDLAGNESEKIEYSIKVDMSAPKFDKYYYTMGSVEGEATGEILTNGNEDIILYGLISDAASGVKDLKLELVDKNGTRSDFVLPEAVLYTSVPTEEKVTDAATGEITVIHHDATTQSLAAWFKADTTTFETTPEDATKVTAWKATVSKSLLSAEGFEGGEIRATYSDNAGNIQKNLLMFRLNVDQIKPELSNQTLEDPTPKFNAVRADIVTGEGESKTTTFRYYVNNSNTHKFNLNGVATDNRGVASVGLKIGSAAPVTQTTTGDFKFTDLDLSSINSTNNKLTLIITDKAANITEVEIQIIPDVTAPKGEHDKDTKGKDLTFRVGDANNDLDEINAVRTTITELTAQDKDVGGKYSEGTYGNSNAIKVRGYFEETGSGLESIYYKIFQGNPPTAADITNFVNDYENAKTGYFAPLSSDEEKLVKKNNSATDSTDYEYVKIASNYKFSIAGFAEGKNYLVLAAVDKVGNIKLDNVTYTYTPTGETTAVALNGCYSINVDTVVPTLSDNVKVEIDGSSEGLSASQILTNFEKGDITLSGSAFDKDSKVSSVTLYVEGKGKKKLGNVVSDVTIDKNTTGSLSPATISTPAVSASTPEGTTNWTGKVAASLFGNLGVESGTFAVYATVKDNAGDGNMVNRSVATIIVDKEAPTVVLKSPVDADSSTTDVEINGIIDLSGEINDGNILPDTAITALQYTTTAPASATDSDWTDATASLMTGFALSGNYTFSAKNFNTSKLTDDTVYYLRAKAIDKAGNVGYSPAVEVKVDQDTDRPIIKFTSMDEANATISNTTITGTISDDDGAVTVFKYKDSTKTDMDWTDVGGDVRNGSWRIDNLSGGARKLLFQITDKVGTVFETKKTFTTTSTEQHFASSGEPYVAFGDSVKALNTDSVNFHIDLNAPVVQSMAIASTTTEDEPQEPAATDTNAVSPYKNTKSFGSEAKYMWIKVIAKEDVAVHAKAFDDITLKIGKKTVTLTETLVKRTGEVGAATTDEGFTYIIGPLDTTSTDVVEEEGSLTVSLVVIDKSGRASDAKVGTIFIDKTAPEVTLTSPNLTSGASTEAIIGKTVIRGRIDDSSVIKNFYYIIPNATQKAAIDAAGYKFNVSTGWTNFKDVDKSNGTAKNDYLERSSMLWELPINSSKFAAPETEEGLSLIHFATARTETTTETGTTSTLTYAETIEGSTNVYVPLYFYSEDETGISAITKTKILVDPYAGVPQLEIITPAADAFTKTGGNLNFQGTASDDAGDLAKVVMTKLEVSTAEVTESTDLTTIDWFTLTSAILGEAGVVKKGTVGENGTITAVGTSSWSVSVITTKIAKAEDSALATLIGTKTEGTKTVAKDITIARATFVGYDSNGTASTFQVSTLANDDTKALVSKIFVDKNAPQLSNVQLVQFAETPTSATATPSLSRSYNAGMFISKNTGNGNWYLKGTVTDDASVEGIIITSDSEKYRVLEGAASKSSDVTNENIIVNSTGTDALGEKTCTFLIPVDTDTTTDSKTQFYITIELDDGQHTDVTQNLSFFVDNDAPTMYLNGSEDGTPDDAISVQNKTKLRLTDYNGLVVGSDNVVENSDGQYSFGDTIKESGSGLAYVAVWFRKDKDGTGYWYNAIETKTATGTSINHGGIGVEIDGTTVKTNDENLPVKVFENCSRPALNQIGNASLAGYTDFGVGSLVKIGGSYHLITDKGENGTSGTITIDDDVDLSFTTVEMVYANVVNHQVAEGFESGWTVSNDDGDGFVEMVKQSGNNYKWQATLRSDFIPDGPVQIHVVAFDEAGNVNSGYVETSIQNNRPRISKVFLGTDLNGNGTFDYFSETAGGAVASNNEYYKDYAANGTEYGELSFYSALSSDGKIQGNVTLKSSNFVAKDKLLVLPEIIGGNTTSAKDLKYLYKVVDDVEDASITKLSIASGSLKSLYTDSDSLLLADKAGTAQTVAELLAENHKADKWNYYDTVQGYPEAGDENTHGGVVTGKYKGLVLDNATLENYESWTSGQTAGKVKYFAFTIWDATSGTTQGKDSLYSLLKIPMVVNVVDDIAPKAVIHPFYWNSKEDGSFCYDEEGVALGHIDIDDGTGTTNPGVSGQVWINATVEDETRLSSATFTDPGDTKMVVANYTDGKWVPVTSGLPEHWKKVEILESPEPNQAGHTMTFRVAIDMTSYGLGNNRTVNAGAVDKSNTESDTEDEQTIDPKAIAGTTHTGKLTSHYIMNFVPYIKSIYPATESSASRSRLGKFPVQAGKPMIIEGMNFAAGAEYWVSFFKTVDGKQGHANNDFGDEYISDKTKIDSSKDGRIIVTAPENSRWVKVWINTADGWIGTMNNENVDYGCNIEDGYVPSDDNGKGNRDRGLKRANDAGTNFWTDDRYIAVWNVPDETLFKGSINPHSGVIKKVDQYNSGSGAPSSVSEGANIAAAPAPGGGWLYKQAGYSTAVDPVTGMNDSYYAAISSDDLKLYGYVSGRTYETHGDNIAFNSSEVAYVAPVDEMDYTIVNGVPYYVMQDNSLGGDSGSVWGLGLCMMREGIWYDRGYFNPYKGNTIEEEKLPYFIERQGYDKASHKRDSSTGYDSVLYQFKNPRITGWYDESDSLRYSSAGSKPSVTGVDYIYISYYDSYAKCLKYAAYRVGHRFKSNDGKYANTALKEWGKIDVDHDLDIVAEMTSSPMTAGNQPEQKTYDHMTDGASVVAGNDTTSNNPTFTEIAGEWSDVLVDTTSGRPRPVIVYYNKTNRSLEVAYGDNEFPQSTSEWTKSTGIRPIGVKSDFGRYVSAAMDKDGNLHVAAQDADTAKLYYLYLTKSGSTYRVSKSVAVDASNGAGRWTDIELTDPEGSSLDAIAPVISYIDTSFMGTTKGVKAAYVVDVEEDGTPIFEAMTDPARYSASDQRTSVMADVKETKAGSVKAPVAVGFNSDMLALDFLRGE